MSTIGRLVIGRDLREAVLIGDDIAVIFTQDKKGTNGQGIRLMVIAPKDLPISRTDGAIDPQELLKAAEKRQIQTMKPA